MDASVIIQALETGDLSNAVWAVSVFLITGALGLITGILSFIAFYVRKGILMVIQMYAKQEAEEQRLTDHIGNVGLHCRYPQCKNVVTERCIE